MTDSSKVPTQPTDEALSLEQQISRRIWDAQYGATHGDWYPPSVMASEIVALVRESIARDIEAEQHKFRPGSVSYLCHGISARIARNGASSW